MPWLLQATVKCLLFPRARAVLLFRLSQHCRSAAALPVGYWLQSRALRSAGTEISPFAEIGPGLCLMHSVGIVVGPEVRAGRNLTLYHGVTLGDGTRPGQPTLGDDVLVGAGASLLGPLVIGNDVLVGAGAVVTRDLPDSVVAVGAPARYHPRTDGGGGRRVSSPPSAR